MWISGCPQSGTWLLRAAALRGSRCVTAVPVWGCLGSSAALRNRHTAKHAFAFSFSVLYTLLKASLSRGDSCGPVCCSIFPYAAEGATVTPALPASSYLCSTSSDRNKLFSCDSFSQESASLLRKNNLHCSFIMFVLNRRKNIFYYYRCHTCVTCVSVLGDSQPAS